MYVCVCVRLNTHQMDGIFILKNKKKYEYLNRK